MEDSINKFGKINIIDKEIKFFHGTNANNISIPFSHKYLIILMHYFVFNNNFRIVVKL